jgi:alkylation response protein AidB-like acyl-CoA dehydrogenase
LTTLAKTGDPFQIEPITEPGRRLVDICESHASDFGTRAAAHDRDASFPFENIAALQQSGAMAACVPEELGGMGVESLHDLAVAISRLARGDGVTAIAATMHMTWPFLLAPEWRAAVDAGDRERVGPIEELLGAIGAGQLVLCTALSEPGTDLLHPMVTGTRVEGGWSLFGRKIFATMSPAAQMVYVTFRTESETGGERTCATFVPAGTPGMEVLECWDGMGMRASASNDVVFRDCVVPAEGVTDEGPWGEWSFNWLVGSLAFTLGLTGASLGMAEAARDHAIELVTTRRKGPSNRSLAERPPIQQAVAENEVDLAICRALLVRTALAADACFRVQTDPGAPLGALHAMMKDFQCTKMAVGRKAVSIVDRAMTLSGGSGYLNSSPLSRLYRDVRAGLFMQPFSPNEAFEYIGRVTLGLDPAIER